MKFENYQFFDRKKKQIFFTFLICLPLLLPAQYEFSSEKRLDCTEVKSQDRTGTCWCFSTISFLESELIRQSYNPIDLSEMYLVRAIYQDKARNYVLRQGKANFSQGSLAHDVFRAMDMVGLMPETAYNGIVGSGAKHNHGEMEKILRGLLDGVIANKNLSDGSAGSATWSQAFNAVLDSYLGSVPQSFEYDGLDMNASKLAMNYNISSDDYVHITSFTHHDFYRPFILEIPDNYSNGSFFNVPLSDLVMTANFALDNGYSLAWDGDVSEAGFSARDGLAILPKGREKKDIFIEPGDEFAVTQISRQQDFESYRTTDDHLMHIVGMSKDQNGVNYYIVKNSWGALSDYEGYLYMSEAYFKAKTVAITLHKDGLPTSVKSKL